MNTSDCIEDAFHEDFPESKMTRKQIVILFSSIMGVLILASIGAVIIAVNASTPGKEMGGIVASAVPSIVPTPSPVASPSGPDGMVLRSFLLEQDRSGGATVCELLNAHGMSYTVGLYHDAYYAENNHEEVDLKVLEETITKYCM